MKLQSPQNDRDWQDPVSRLTRTAFDDDGEHVHVLNIRNWRYDEDGPTRKNWVSRTYDSTEIEQVWLVVESFSAWQAVAHTYFVFEFTSGETVAVSVEARKEKHESYGLFKGMFRKFELVYVWSEEHDATTRRAIFEGNNIAMYPLHLTPPFEEALFRAIAEDTEALAQAPRFYHTLTDNCTSILADTANTISQGSIPRFAPARIMPGYSGRFLYRRGLIDTSASTYKEAREQFTVTEIVQDIADMRGRTFAKELRKRLEQQQAQENAVDAEA